MPSCDILHIIHIQNSANGFISHVCICFSNPGQLCVSSECLFLSVIPDTETFFFFYEPFVYFLTLWFRLTLWQESLLKESSTHPKLSANWSGRLWVPCASASRSQHWGGTALHTSWHVIPGEGQEKIGQLYVPSLLELKNLSREKRKHSNSESDFKPHHSLNLSKWCLMRILYQYQSVYSWGCVSHKSLWHAYQEPTPPSLPSSLFLSSSFPPSFLSFLLALLGTESVFHMLGESSTTKLHRIYLAM